MSDKLFEKKSFQPPGMGWALFFSVCFICLSFLTALWALGPVDAAYFVLTEYGWTADAANEAIHPLLNKLSLTFRYLTVVPPLISLFWGIGRRGIGKFQSGNMLSDHTVVCGLGWQGRSFIKSLHARGRKVVGIELAADEPAEKFCLKKNCTLIYGNADDESVLESAGIFRAKEVYICTGNQDQNLSIAKSIGGLMQAANRPDNPLQVHVSLGELPIDDADTDQLFFPLLQASVAGGHGGASVKRDNLLPRVSKNCHFVVYDPDRRMARCFYYRHKVYQWADEMATTRRWLQSKTGAVDQDPVYRVHLVFLGFTRLVGELILQYARIWPSENQLPPYFTIICEDDRDASAFLSRHACLTEEENSEQFLESGTVFCRNLTIKDNFAIDPLLVVGRGKLAKPGVVFIRARSDNSEFLDKSLMEEIDCLSPVTTVICSAESSSESLQRASHCKDLAKRVGLWQVPVFTDLEERQGTEGLLEIAEAQPFVNDRTIPFGSSLHYCDTGLLSYADELAKAIHDSYYEGQKSVERGTEQPDSLLPAVKRWSALEQRYQRSNYRAADAALLKLYSAGYRWHTVTPHAHIEGFNDEQEVLSRAEHQSWVNEKLVDHWRFGKRNEQRKRHPSILPWLHLSEKDRNKDKDQIATLRAQFESDAPNAGKPLTIGVIGHTNITKPQARSCAEQLEQLLGQIDELKATDKRCWLQLASPLAPGSDIAMIDEAIDILQRKAYSIAGIRLLVPHAVSWPEVDEDFHSHWLDNNQWLVCQENYNHSGSKAEWAAFKEAIQQSRERIFSRMRKTRYPVDVVDLRINGDMPFTNGQGYILAAQWIVDHCNALVAVLDDDRKSVATDEWVDGGTGHTVAQWETHNGGRLIRLDPNAKLD